MQFGYTDLFFILVLFLLLFTALFLITSDKGKRISNVLIGSFFLALFLNLLDSFLLLKGVYLDQPALALWGSGLLLTCGPFIFLYTQSILYKDFRFSKKSWLHFFPFLVAFMVLQTGYWFEGRSQQIQMLHAILERQFPNSFYFAGTLLYLHFILYLGISLKLLDTYRKAATNQFSNVQQATLGWLRTSIYFFLILILISAVNAYVSFQLLKQTYYVIFTGIVFLIFQFVILSLVKILRNPQIFSSWNEEEIRAALHPVKYAVSQLDTEQKLRILNQLVHHMQLQKPYLDPDLTLDTLADQLQVKPKILSQVINELRGQNFFEFINSYRIEEAKLQFTNPKDSKITVLEVMYAVGFNSKSSFNTVFKKYTGSTPSEFKRNMSE